MIKWFKRNKKTTPEQAVPAQEQDKSPRKLEATSPEQAVHGHEPEIFPKERDALSLKEAGSMPPGQEKEGLPEAHEAPPPHEEETLHPPYSKHPGAEPEVSREPKAPHEPGEAAMSAETSIPGAPAEANEPASPEAADSSPVTSRSYPTDRSDPSDMSDLPAPPHLRDSSPPISPPDASPGDTLPPAFPGEPPQKRRFFQRLRERMHKTRESFTKRVDRLILGKKTIDADLLDDLEEVLITSDLGVRTTQLLLQRVADRIKRKELSDPAKLQEQLRGEIETILSIPAAPLDFTIEHPFVVMIVGVNGVGKTTTIGKLAHQLKSDGKKVMLAACDTFRAAAVEQLVLWGERADVPVIRQKSGSDPSAVAFDAMDAALSRDVDVLLLDTAGRMHTKVNLMEELKKVHRTVIKKMPSAPHEIWLVLDASTGQNALSQAKLFKEAIGITGLILTKLDGTAKGGIVVAISEELQLPVRYIGIGESLDDLRPFDPEEFARAIF